MTILNFPCDKQGMNKRKHRIDNHNLLGTFITPRLHMRYVPWEKGVLRASVGKGVRSANIFAENQQLFASSRQINIINNGGNIYGLNPERAWNYGFSFLQGFTLFDKYIGIDWSGAATPKRSNKIALATRLLFLIARNLQKCRICTII